MPARPSASLPPHRLRSRRSGASLAALAARAARVTLVALVATLVAQSGCRTDPQDDPLRREPALLIEGPSLLRLLDRLAGLAGTPAGTASRQLAQRLRDCPEVAGHLPRSEEVEPANGPSSTDAASPRPASASSASAGADESAPPSIAASLDALACRVDRPLEPALAALLERERGDHAGLLQWPIGTSGRLVLRIDVDEAGGLAVDGFLDDARGDGPAALLLPAEAAPGPAAIGQSDSLVHLRLRPANGLRLAELIPQGSQGDRLFALKGRLLEGALLEGTLELGFVAPAPGGSVPLALLALHHRAAAPIEAALGEALDQLERTWGLVRSPRPFATADRPRMGGCYADLPILPEFAPCWVVTDDALLIGYRAEAVEAALADAAPSPTADPDLSTASSSASASATASASASEIVVDFDRVRALDAAIAGPSGASLATLYSRLELRGRTGSDGRIVLDGLLRARR